LVLRGPAGRRNIVNVFQIQVGQAYPCDPPLEIANCVRQSTPAVLGNCAVRQRRSTGLRVADLRERSTARANVSQWVAG
jgi:hypothetical protein